MKFALKIIVALTAILLFTGCDPVMSPDKDGEIYINMLNVDITFDIDNDRVEMFNQNANPARAIIEKYTSSGIWLAIIDQRMSSHRLYEEIARLEAGDMVTIKMAVEDVTQQKSFTVGDKASLE